MDSDGESSKDLGMQCYVLYRSLSSKSATFGDSGTEEKLNGALALAYNREPSM